MEYQRAWEAGRKAAQYVIKRWPGMFPEADTPPEGQSPQGDSEEALKGLSGHVCLQSYLGVCVCVC